jgi:hypothetical protein
MADFEPRPCHHNLEAWPHEYIDQTGIGADPKGPLFRTIGSGTGKLTATPCHSKTLTR